MVTRPQQLPSTAGRPSSQPRSLHLNHGTSRGTTVQRDASEVDRLIASPRDPAAAPRPCISPAYVQSHAMTHHDRGIER